MIATPVTQALVRGVAELEPTARGLRPHRLPAWVRAQLPDPQLLMVEAQPSGVRLALVTAARRVELVTHPSRVAYRGADRPRGSIDLVVDGRVAGSQVLAGGDVVVVDLMTGAGEHVPGAPHTTVFDDLPAGEKVVELWLPHNESVELVELRTDAPVAPAPQDRRVWLHHGSSISHGSNAATPTGTWPAVAARLGGVELHNLGFGGGALVDPAVARVMRDTPADLVSVKLGINVVNADAMRLRSFVPAVHGFLDTIRDGHPDVPLVLVTPIFCPIHEDTPGPGAVDPASLGTGQVTFTATGRPGDTAQGRLTLRVIRDALASVVERRGEDPNLHLLDGTALYGERDAAAHPLPDALHPDAATHRLIGERFAAHAFATSGPFAAG
ncbi:GDSL-type esterase/lipase family protein [Actinotalea subterranea]|uniref:GDSL-type esterase/lipase family protein n=1 Tax=Actinotalea subterranea TaxID=2607497 RepID=UPI0011EEAF9C|nr:GDSL-type esterase/lipase family protein [Actinotalea subterranea]